MPAPRHLTWLALLVMLAVSSCAAGRHDLRAVAAGSALRRMGPTAWKPWTHWTLERSAQPKLDLYVAANETPKPLLVMLQGSGCDPLFEVGPPDAEGTTRRSASLFYFANAARDVPSVHVLAIEKRGVRSFTGLDNQEPICSAEYERGLSKADRVADVLDAIAAFSSQPWVTQVLLLGHSEGADLATGVAKALGPGKLAAVGLLSSAGPTQLFDFMVFDRRNENHRAVLDDFHKALELLGPNAPARFAGHSALRWQSYAVDSTPLQDMSDLDVPVFVAHGSKDQNSPIESADLFVIELLRQKPKRPVYYFMVPDATHGFVGADGRDHSAEVIGRFLEWSAAPKKITAVVDK